MSKFYISQECIKGDTAFIVGQEAHHILDVLRYKKGDKLQLFDGTGKLYQSKILDTQAKEVRLKIESVREESLGPNLKITLVQALPKKNKMDYIVEKATELGVDVIIPIQTARTIVKLDKQRQNLRKKRWQRIAQEASKQCGRETIPQVKGLTAWKDVLSILNDYDLKLLACLGEKRQKIKDVLQAQSNARNVIFLIGPEGDFDPEEVRQARDAGCIALSLGKIVLKSDTAAISALAMINYELKW